MANTTADKLARLEETKETLTSKLIEKGLDVPDNTTFLERAEMVGEIKSNAEEYVTLTFQIPQEVVLEDSEYFVIQTEEGVLNKRKISVGETILVVKDGLFASCIMDATQLYISADTKIVSHSFFLSSSPFSNGKAHNILVGKFNQDKVIYG